jgi:hypothetical protein
VPPNAKTLTFSADVGGSEEATPDDKIEAQGEDRADRRRQEVPGYVPLSDFRRGEIPADAEQHPDGATQ